MTLTEDQKTGIRKITGLAAGVFTLFTVISVVSYLVHWTGDMSGQNVANAAGSLGAAFGRLLVCECFGIGSLALVVIGAALCVRLFSGKWRWSLVRTFVLTIVWMFLSSVILAYAGDLLGAGCLFGGGLGGYFGAFVSKWLCSVVGVTVAGVLEAFCAVIALAFSSGDFVRWLAGKGSRKRDISPDEDILPDEIPQPVEEPVAEPVRVEPEALQAQDDPSLEIIVDENGLDTSVHKDLPRINNRLDPPEGLPHFKTPSLELLSSHSDSRRVVSEDEVERNTARIRTTLANYRIRVEKVQAVVGPTVTLYKVYPEQGVRIAEIKKLQDDVAMSLNAKGVRIVTLSDSVGIEVANDHQSIVPLKALLNDPSFRESKAELPVAIGYTITQKVRVFDLADAPHLLVAGATKQGKSVGLNVIVSSLLYSKHPSELKFVFIDPKMVEFSAYSSLLKHYLAVLPDALDEEDERETAIVKTPKGAEKVLRSLCTEMDERYSLLSKAGVNKLTSYNEKFLDRKLNPENGHRFLPYLVVVVDEYADLTMTTGASPESKTCARSITSSIIRLAQKGRAAGLHVILATQRPSVDVISGLIKSNFPMRIAFRTSQRNDSMTILDSPGAEKLIGKGDMLLSAGVETERLQCGYVSTEEVDKITLFIGSQTKHGQIYNTPYYLPSVEDASGGSGSGSLNVNDLDERFADAARLVVTTQKGSTSDLQRRLGMGYAKAGRVMDQLESAGIVGPQEGSKPRQVLISDTVALEELLSELMKQ